MNKLTELNNSKRYNIPDVVLTCIYEIFIIRFDLRTRLERQMEVLEGSNRYHLLFYLLNGKIFNVIDFHDCRL